MVLLYLHREMAVDYLQVYKKNRELSVTQ